MNLVEILKDCPKGTKLYTPIWGEVVFVEVVESGNSLYPILIFDSINNYIYLTKDGHYLLNRKDSECIIFPSKDQRDWSKFSAPWYKNEKFDPKTLNPFDRVLARIDGGNAYCWFADFVSTATIEKYDLLPCIMSNKDANMIIPYNEETKHLIGTTEEAPEYYSYWED